MRRHIAFGRFESKFNGDLYHVEDPVTSSTRNMQDDLTRYNHEQENLHERVCVFEQRTKMVA